MTQKGRVSPFGDPRIKGCSPLPAAFRSVPRPSSPLSRSTFYLLSDGLSIQHRRITNSDFRPCSTHRSRSQAPLYVYARCPIANRAEGTFELLRYRLGGDRPSQTAQIALSAARIHGTGLEIKHDKAGVSATAPRDPRIPVHSLPATLRMTGLSPIRSYS